MIIQMHSSFIYSFISCFFGVCYEPKHVYNFINIINMSRMLKDPKSIGKLSRRKLNIFDQSLSKKISAVLPQMSVKSKRSRISQSALLAEGKEDPLPYIKAGTKPLKMKARSARNPEEEVFYIDGSQKKIGHCMAVQMDSPRHSQAGKLYNPSLQLFNSPGKIRHQHSSQIAQKPPLEETIQKFKNFLQHKYVQEMQQKRKGVTIIEYDRRFGDSVNSTAYKDNARYEPEKYIQPVCSESQAKPFYMSTSFLKMNEIYLKDDGFSFTPCYKEEVNMRTEQNTSQTNHLLLESTSSHISIQINFQTSISKLKQILIEEQDNLHLSFIIPNHLRTPLKNLGSQQEIHRAAQDIFEKMINFKPQLVSLKKFCNCFLLVAKSPHNSNQRYALLWYFNGSFYFGGWSVNNSKNEGCKSGIGIEYTVNQCIYFGQFANNKSHGYGALKKGSGETFVGEWREGERFGWGKLFESSGYLSLDGNFENDNFAGNRIQSKVIVA